MMVRQAALLTALVLAVPGSCLAAPPATPAADAGAQLAAPIGRQDLALCNTPAGLAQLARARLPAGTKLPADSVGAAAHAAIWGLPLLEVAATARVTAETGGSIVANQFLHRHALAGGQAAEGGVIVSPNADTVYSNAFIDTSSGPVVLDVPPSSRYFVVQLMDMNTNLIAAVSLTTIGTRGGRFVIVGPSTQAAQLPAEFKACAAGKPPGAPPPLHAAASAKQADARASCVIRSPTSGVFAVVRVLQGSDSEQDRAAVAAFQRGLKLTPPPGAPATKLAATLGAASRLYRALPSGSTRLDPAAAGDYFKALSVMLAAFSAPASDAALFRDVYAPRLGLHANGRLVPPADAPQLYAAGLLLGQACLAAASAHGDMMAALVQGPNAPPPTSLGNWRPSAVAVDGRFTWQGDFGDAFLVRALVAKLYIAALPPSESLYFLARSDEAGRVLSFAGAKAPKAFTVTFPGPLPAKAFWSLSLYNASSALLFENPVRSSVGDRTRGLVWEAAAGGRDKALTITISPLSRPPPKGSAAAANWLPAPDAETFYVLLRLYQPSGEAAAGRYAPPPVLAVAA